LPCQTHTLRVSSSALRWRLVELGEISLATARDLPESALHNNGLKTAEKSPPALFSHPFVEVIGLALEQGRLSVNRAGALLDLSVEDLEELFVAHGIECPWNH